MESSGTMYQCRRCGTLLLKVVRPENKPDLREPKDRQQFYDAGGNPIPHNEEHVVFDVSGHWDEIRDWFCPRRDETNAKQAELADNFAASKYDLERRLRFELCQMVEVLVGKTSPRSGLTLVKR